MPQDLNQEKEPASPQAQRAAIDAAVLARLGENWEKEWIIVHSSNDLLRVNKGDKNLDFQADLLANVEIIEREANPVQLSGRWIAWLLLGLSLFVAFVIASVAGVFN
jgi:hypothetical protein